MVIRKQDFKMYKYDTRCKNVEKVFSHCRSDYLDPLDREMLIMRHQRSNVTSTNAPKWLNMCWDSFRHVDNHNKSHIFQPKLSLQSKTTNETSDVKRLSGKSSAVPSGRRRQAVSNRIGLVTAPP